MTKPVALVLAAGAATRYRAAGGSEPSKLVAAYLGEPVVRWTARAALAAGLEVIVVTGHARDAVEAALGDLDVSFTHNANFAAGLASSLKAGVAAAPSRAPGVIVLLGDMPSVSSAVITKLAEALAAEPQALAVVPVHAKVRGNPVLLSRELFPDIGKLDGDEGARRLIAACDPSRVIEVDVDEAAIMIDVDTPADLAPMRDKP